MLSRKKSLQMRKNKIVYRQRKKIFNNSFCSCIAFCFILTACASTGIQSNGISTSGIRSDISELQSEQCDIAITSTKLENGIANIERTIDEGKGNIKSLEQLLRRIRCQVINGTTEDGKTE